MTSDTNTGADTPWAGRISTLPTTRGYDIVSQCLFVHVGIQVREAHTDVAEMPGYPTRKLLFGGPETLTKAEVVIVSLSSSRMLQPSWAPWC